MTEVYFTRPGHKDFRSLQEDLKNRIEEKLREVQASPARYLKRLRGRDLFALRVGSYRVIVDWDRDQDVVYVHAIGHRRNVYDRDV